MEATLNIAQLLVAFGDVPPTANPGRNYLDWQESINGIPVSNPSSKGYTVDPNATLAVFSGVRSTSISNTTEFAMALSTIPGDSVRYRFTWTSVGANPALRTDRNLTLATHSATFTVNANSTATLAATVGDFNAAVVGDILYLGDTTLGDAFTSPFSVLNVGYWTVISKAGDGSSVTLQRPTGASFSAIGETVTVSSNQQVQGFSAAGVQVGDKVTISAGFSVYVQNTYTVDRVNPKWFEVLSTSPLPTAETAVPTTSGIAFYTGGKRVVALAGDQRFAVQTNGDSGTTQRVEPWQAGDPDQMGWYLKVGPTWQLSVVNLTPTPLGLVVITAE